MQIVDFRLNSVPTNIACLSIIATAALLSVIFLYRKGFNYLPLLTFFVIILFFLVCKLSEIKTPNTLVVKYINENVNENEINISKEQIINDILNDKIKQNENNLKVYYSQRIPITKEEYERLSKYKEEYNQKIENGNVNIIN